MAYNYNYFNKPKTGRNNRADHKKGHRREFERNRKKIIAANNICAICGRLVDKKLKYPDLMCATVDHIIPISKGGHPSDINNLQLAHFRCNRQKSDKLQCDAPQQEKEIVDNRNLPLSLNWAMYSEDKQGTLRAEVERIEANGKHLYMDGVR